MATPTGAERHPGRRHRGPVSMDPPGSLAALRSAIREVSECGLAVHTVPAWELPLHLTFGDMATVGDFHPVIATAASRPITTR